MLSIPSSPILLKGTANRKIDHLHWKSNIWKKVSYVSQQSRIGYCLSIYHWLWVKKWTGRHKKWTGTCAKDKKNLTGKQARWLEVIAEFGSELTIELPWLTMKIYVIKSKTLPSMKECFCHRLMNDGSLVTKIFKFTGLADGSTALEGRGQDTWKINKNHTLIIHAMGISWTSYFDWERRW